MSCETASSKISMASEDAIKEYRVWLASENIRSSDTKESPLNDIKNNTNPTTTF
jgi:hypothetical protein